MNFKPQIRTHLLNGILVLISLAIILSIVELSLRGVRAYHDIGQGRKMCRLSQNPSIGHEHIPGYVWKKFRVNSYGFRGAEFDPVKKEHSSEKLFRDIMIYKKMKQAMMAIKLGVSQRR